jgi:outer membrane protein assembly factor BamB
VVYQDKLFVLDGDKRMLTCLDPKTGVKKWQGDVGVRENFKASPTAADGRIYCVSERGTVVVLDAGDEFKILATVKLESTAPTRSSVVAADGALFIRTGENLVCISR